MTRLYSEEKEASLTEELRALITDEEKLKEFFMNLEFENRKDATYFYQVYFKIDKLQLIVHIPLVII